MPANIRVKVCGVTEPKGLRASVEAGAAYIGFNFIERSKRFAPLDVARDLAIEIPPGVAKVGLTLDATDAELDAITDAVPLDFLQLHGSESPDRVAAVKARYGLPVIKAVGLADAGDLPRIDLFSQVADQILVDAKPPRSGDLPGGNGLTFDWRLVADHDWTVPWMLAGGLTADNVAEAIRLTGTRQVDLASGVEAAPGIKSPDLLRAFFAATRA